MLTCRTMADASEARGQVSKQALGSSSFKALTLPLGPVLVIQGVSTGVGSRDEFLQNKYFLKQSHVIWIWFEPEMPPKGHALRHATTHGNRSWIPRALTPPVINLPMGGDLTLQGGDGHFWR